MNDPIASESEVILRMVIHCMVYAYSGVPGCDAVFQK